MLKREEGGESPRHGQKRGNSYGKAEGGDGADKMRVSTAKKNMQVALI